MSQLPLLSSQLPPSSSVFPSPTLGALIPLLLAKCLHVYCIERLRNEANACPCVPQYVRCIHSHMHVCVVCHPIYSRHYFNVIGFVIEYRNYSNSMYDPI